MRRLALLLLAPLLLAADFAPVKPGVVLRFPADHGAHPAFRTEWWYVTGWVQPKSGTSAQGAGIQITFFRTRLPRRAPNRSRFATEQVIFAHAAIADPATGRLRHATRIARSGFGLAQARVGIWMWRWTIGGCGGVPMAGCTGMWWSMASGSI